ncbi:pretoxin hint domain protein [Teratosphaeria destructans]|uniref:Pretoxin hint domain protein n=1 Tax=Teratosphaeria destructans TaxID=418781 RepID=A0A9W7VZL9_9PEZI|nr:pretoxin hint domain protein [Teratosphaeria destructans]
MFGKLTFASLLGYGLAQPGMIFNCADNLQDICNNMCWGAYCTRPSFGVTLNYDRYGGTGDRSGAVGRARTNGGNPRAGENCDEYPFASTSDADKGGQVTKCVVSRHNSRQGNIIQQFYANTCNNQACQFTVTFGNPTAPGVQYCEAYNDPHGQCINDQVAPIYKNGAPDVRPASKKRSELEVKAQAALFLMSSGMKVLMPIDTLVNSTFVHPTPRNHSMKAWVEDNDEDEDLIEWDFIEDVVAARLD